VVVVLNEHGGWGAEAAAPPAGKIIRAYFDLKAQDAHMAEVLKVQQVEQQQAATAVPVKAMVQ